MEVGEVWAYRERGRLPLREVRIIGLSKKPKPSRIKVYFLEDDFEGAAEWVPIGRLKTPWEEHAVFLADEERVDALHSSANPSKAEVLLTHEVFHHAGEGNFDLMSPDSSGVAEIQDLALAERLTGLTSAELTGHPLTYLRNGVHLVPWNVARSIMVGLLSKNPRVATRLVSEYEAEIESEAHEFRTRHFERFFAPTGEELERLLAQARDESIYGPMLDLLREILEGAENASLAEHVRLNQKAIEHEALLLDVLQVFGHRHSQKALELLERIRHALGLPSELA